MNWKSPVFIVGIPALLLILLLGWWVQRGCDAPEDRRPRTAIRPTLFLHDHFDQARSQLQYRNKVLGNLHMLVDSVYYLRGAEKQRAESLLAELLTLSEKQTAVLEQLKPIIKKNEATK